MFHIPPTGLVFFECSGYSSSSSSYRWLNDLAMRYFSAALADSSRPRLVEAVWLRRVVTQNDWSPLMRSMLAMTT